MKNITAFFLGGIAMWLIATTLLLIIVPDVFYEEPEQIIDYTNLENQLLLQEIKGKLKTTNKLLDSQQSLMFDIANKEIIINQKPLTDMEFIDEARKRFDKERKWVAGEYDCDHFTNDFTYLMNEGFGIELFVLHAFNDNSNIGHTFNCVPYDAQFGLVHTNDWEKYTMVRRALERNDKK